MRRKMNRLNTGGLSWLAAVAAVIVSLQMMSGTAFGQAQILDAAPAQDSPSTKIHIDIDSKNDSGFTTADTAAV